MTTKVLGDARARVVGGLEALLLSVILGALGTVFLLSSLGTAMAGSASKDNDSPANPRSIAIVPTVTTIMHGVSAVDPCSIDLVLVQDCSGSMTEWMIASKSIVSASVSYLGSTDRAAVAPFSTTADVVQPLTTNKRDVLDAIAGLSADGWTKLGGGISVGREALSTSSPDIIKAIVLLSDGWANYDEEGETTADAAAAYAREQATLASGDGIRIYSVGFGDANEELLRRIAEISGGEYFSASVDAVAEKLYSAIACKSAYLPAVMREYCGPPGFSNGDFEDGSWSGWAHGGRLSQTITSAHPHSGDFSALLGVHTWDPGPNYDYHECRSVPEGSAWMEQTVYVTDTASPQLSFYYEIWTHARNQDLENMKDLFEVRVNGFQAFSDMNQTEPYGCRDEPTLVTGVKTIDLGAYKGRCVTIRFENWNRGSSVKYNTWTYVDDVRIDH